MVLLVVRYLFSNDVDCWFFGVLGPLSWVEVRGSFVVGNNGLSVYRGKGLESGVRD